MRTVLSFAAVFVMAATALASDDIIGVGEVALLEDGVGAARIVFRPAPPELPEYVAIGRATLEFDLPSAGEVRRLRLRVHPVTTSWRAGLVSWTAGWSRPGGDFDEDLAADAEVVVGRGGEVGFDVTGILQEIHGGLASDGFILTVPKEVGIGLRVEDAQAFSNLGAARLEVSFRKVTPPPREVRSRR